MSGTMLLVGVLVLFLLAYFCYGAFLKKAFGVDKSKLCPSETKQDGIDYVPTPAAVLFGHHFASIAGAGPIVGPIAAMYLGWGPAMLWIVVGCIFVGSMHDFAALFLSVRNEGRSIAYVIERELGYWGRQIFLFFCFATLILVVAVFTSQVADTFMKTPAVATASILFIFMAPVFGVMTNKGLITFGEATLVFVPLLFVLIWMGTLIPLDLVRNIGCSAVTAKNIWCVFLLYYALCASVLPVWLLLQPRDYLNSFLLYVMMILGFAGVVAYRPELQVPAFVIKGNMTPGLFPLLFVTIACGACSGFHALVASGTSSKQLAKESHILPIGYGSMLVEGLLATMAVISVCYTFTDMESFTALCKKPPVAFAQGLAQFTVKLGIPLEIGETFMSLAISAFMLTSLDTATRLARFVFQELVLPRGSGEVTEASQMAAVKQKVGGFRSLVSSRWIATLIIVLPACWLVLSGESMSIWPVFGSANQLLAALTLLSVSLWLMRNKRPVLFAMLPLFFMMVISGWALVILIHQYLHSNPLLAVIGAILLGMAVVLLVFSISKMRSVKKA